MGKNIDFLDYLKEIGFKWEDRFDYHIANNKLTSEEYRLLIKNNFTSSIQKNACKIYLDLNVWIFFRDVFMGKTLKDPKWIDVFQKAIYLNEFHDVCFVISPNLYYELQKQKISEEYAVLLKIMGKLSKELTIEEPMQLVFDETIFCLMDILRVKDPCFDSDNYQWDKASAIFGIPLLQNETNEMKVALNKTMIDAIYQIPFGDFNKLFETKDDFTHGFEEVSGNLNDDLDYKVGVRSRDLEELYNEEFQGVIEASSEIINAAIAFFMKWYYKTDSIEIAAIKEKGLINMFPNLFRSGKIHNYFPSLQTHARLHASVRYDKTKKFTQNDLFDFHHASSAIHYCNYFITDNPLAQRLTNKPIAIGKKFDTVIIPADTCIILRTFDNIINKC